MAKLNLPTVTLCAATSVNVPATIAALRACLEQVDFADCLLLTDTEVASEGDQIRVVPIEQLGSARDYSDFIIEHLADHVRTTHCLVVQWDGFVLDAGCWDPGFLEYDYIGAPWPQFDDPHNVGNGGFSLRSRRLLDACRDPRFVDGHPEDLAICRTNRSLLEDNLGIRFADAQTASRFAFERTPSDAAFGFHGIFNMIPLLGAERFWKIYNSLDDGSTAVADWALLVRQLSGSRRSIARRMRLIVDAVRARLGR